MKITKVNIPKNTGKPDGLEDIYMDKLGQVVLLAGKNGAGKTRLLKKVTSSLLNKPGKTIIEDLERQLANLNVEIVQSSASNDQLKASLSALPPDMSPRTIQRRQEYDFMMSQNSQKQGRAEKQRKSVENQLKWNFIETSECKEQYPFVFFVPKTLQLTDSNSLNKNEQRHRSANLNTIGVDLLHEKVFAKIQVVQDKWFEVTHHSFSGDESEKKLAEEEYERLNDVLKIFLGTGVKRNSNSDATLFGFELGKSQLSDGQKILLQFCLAIHCQNQSLKDIIVVMDEPENHLHPQVIIDMIDRIREFATDGQIWISTHSIPLLSHFDTSSIWYVEKGSVTHAGKIPQKVLESLLGDESAIAKLQDFIGLPAQYAANIYALECLLEPQSVMTGAHDPQSMQIKRSLLDKASTGKIKILDYGAGKGRILANIFDLDSESESRLLENIEYIAYDEFATDKEHCENEITRAYGDCKNKYYNDISNLLSHHDPESFDVVIMCNVLHEIDPKKWLNLFKIDGTIPQLLKENGILLVVEDHQMPIGEKAYRNGFIGLDTPQLKELFKAVQEDLKIDEEKTGRLKAHQIPKRCIIQIDEVTRRKALQSIAKIAKDKILAIREKEPSYANGKIHSYWTQQFANVQLALSELE